MSVTDFILSWTLLLLAERKENVFFFTFDAPVIVRKEKAVLYKNQYYSPHSILDASITGGKKKYDCLHLTLLLLLEKKLNCTYV